MSQEQPGDIPPVEEQPEEAPIETGTPPVPRTLPPPPPQPITLPNPRSGQPQPITLSNPQPEPQTRRFDMRQVSTTFSQEWMEKSQEITAQWLYELGGWIFGGLIVAALMILQDLISLGFADRATLIAGLALALALPFNLAGLAVIRYFRDLNQAAEKARQALAQSPNLDAETLINLTQESEAFSPGKRRIMDSSVSLALYVSVLFTLIGLSAALWRISWAATLLFLLACVLGAALLVRVLRA